MAELKAKTPCEGLLPVTFGCVTLDEIELGHVASLMPFKVAADMSAALDAAHGVAFPTPNRTTRKGDVRCVWFGRGQALLMGAVPDARLVSHGAVVDQSDAWCAVTLTGPMIEDVLARLVPVDLRAGQFKRGHTARTQLGHMMVSVTRTGPEQFMLLVFRSMAASLVHDISRAMQAVAARRA